MSWTAQTLQVLAELPEPLVLAAAGAIAFAETGFGLGMLVPGEIGVVVLSATTSASAWGAAMVAVVGSGVSGGDHLGYWLGRRYGMRLRGSRPVRRIGVRHWDRATVAVRRHGAAAVFLTRLLPLVRTLTPAIAGASGVRYRGFLLASVCGSMKWAAVYVSIGAFASELAPRMRRVLGAGGWAVLATVLAVVVGTLLVRRRRAPGNGAGPDSTW